MLIKVKKFKSKSKASAKQVYNLSDEQYEQIAAYIEKNNCTEETTLCAEETPNGSFSIIPANDNGQDDTYDNRHLSPNSCSSGNYVKATIGVGQAPIIHGASTNPVMSMIYTTVILISAVTAIAWQIVGLVYAIQDRKAARANTTAATNASLVAGDQPTNNVNNTKFGCGQSVADSSKLQN